MCGALEEKMLFFIIYSRSADVVTAIKALEEDIQCYSGEEEEKCFCFTLNINLSDF